MPAGPPFLSSLCTGDPGIAVFWGPALGTPPASAPAAPPLAGPPFPKACDFLQKPCQLNPGPKHPLTRTQRAVNVFHSARGFYAAFVQGLFLFR